MAEMEIRLRRDPATGRQDIHISLHSDDDSLPHEHEQAHRDIVEKLVGKGILKAEEIGNITIEREANEKEPAAPVSNTPETERNKQSQNG